MPKIKPTEDDYWGAADTEMVALGGSFEYCNRLLCGDTIPVNTFPQIRHNNAVRATPTAGGVVYDNQSSQVVYYSQVFSGAATTIAHTSYGYEQAINIPTWTAE